MTPKSSACDIGCPSVVRRGDGLDPTVDVVAVVGVLSGRLDTRDAYRLRLAADEIATNVVTHGYVGQGGYLVISGGAGAGSVWMAIEDEAPPFDPRTHDATHRLAQNPRERAAGGLGVHLAITSVDEFCYEHVDGRNLTTLILHVDDRRTR